MDWKTFWVTFCAIFLAELGDKTQLGVLTFAATGKSPLGVFFAASAGLIASTLVGVLAGQWLGKLVNPAALRALGGALFVAVGVWMLFSKD